MEHVIERAVMTIRERYWEPLSLDDLAHQAMVSKFHFLRSFRRFTGVTPGRFLTAVRLQEAKRLLVTTSANVADISAQVGYGSTGSFTRRFTESVGCSPTEYRSAGRGGARGRIRAARRRPGSRHLNEVCGVVRSPGGGCGDVYLGLFESPILERSPIAWTVVGRPGPFRLTGVPSGTWYLHAVTRRTLTRTAPPAGEEDTQADWPLAGSLGPLEIRPGADQGLELALRPVGWAHPPILFSLLLRPAEFAVTA